MPWKLGLSTEVTVFEPHLVTLTAAAFFKSVNVVATALVSLNLSRMTLPFAS